MWNRYQDYANAQNRRVARADSPVVGQFFNPGTQYQAWANTFNTRMIHSDDPQVPHTPVEHMARGSQIQANSFLEQITNHDDLQLRGVPGYRPSGSLARAPRVVRGLGGQMSQILDPGNMDFEKSCAGLDAEKWLPVIFGFFVGNPNASGGMDKIIDEASAQFGKPLLACWFDALAKDQFSKNVPKSQQERWRKAGQKMFENGWWQKEDWYDYWVRWSGAEPFYKNPYYVGGIGAVVAAGAWFVLRKRR